MSGAIDSALVSGLVGAPIKKLLEQLMLQEFEPRACFTHGREIGRKLLSAVAGKDLRKLAVARFESWQRGKGGTSKIFEGIVCHGLASTNLLEGQFGRAALHWRYTAVGVSAVVASINEVVAE